MALERMQRVRLQGNLDGLCGVYSVVNASAFQMRLDDTQTKKLFEKLCEHLGDEGRLEDALCQGMYFKTLGRLIDVSSEFLQSEALGKIQRGVKFRRKPASLAQFWGGISSHVAENGPGSVILGMSGKYDHWTCVQSVSQSSISLIDSDGLKRLMRQNCTVSVSRKGRHHELWPTQTYFLKLLPA
tara:strand:+ start:1301 stop:1855 length:555 start_codon:yes stop_codon:yes gene_type:complete